MLGDYDVRTDIGVKDLSASRKFYEETLGLKTAHENEWEVYYKSGNSTLKIYLTEFAGTNKATYCSWNVDDVENVVNALKGKGVQFEHYPNMPNVTLQGDVHIMDGGEVKAAWFKDPDGNILCVSTMSN